VFDHASMGTEGALQVLQERIRPVALARERQLPVAEALQPLLPFGGLRRGSTVAVSTAAGVGGATSLALALVAEASRTGSWLAAVGLPSLGLVAADEAGLALERLVMVAAPERSTWGGVVAALVDGFDLLLLHAGRGGVRPTDARKLVARARERGAVLVQLGPGWGTEADVALEVTDARWEGPDAGHGHLRARRVVVAGGGRGAAARPKRVELWLPGPDGHVAPAAPTAELATPGTQNRVAGVARTSGERPLRAVG
jgi:hypothetical protein